MRIDPELLDKEFDPMIERAARLYCEWTGTDPDGGPTLAHKTIAGMTKKLPNWKLIAQELTDLHVMISAITTARKQLADEEANQVLGESKNGTRPT